MTGAPTDVAKALDRSHRAAREAYLARDAGGTCAIFAPDLEFVDVGGHRLDLPTLSRQIEKQLRTMSAATTSYRREALDIVDGQAIEVVRQRAWYAASAFGLIHRAWRLERVGRWAWRDGADGWKARRVQVLEEQVTPLGWRFGRRPTPPDEATLTWS